MTNRADDFNRADSGSGGGIGTPSDGGTAWVQLGSGVWDVLSNKAREGAGVGNWNACYLETSQADGDVQVTLSTISANPGLAGRITDTSNFIMTPYISGTLYVFKHEAGSDLQLGSTYTGGLSNGDVLKMNFSGNNITVSQNGTSRIATSSAFNNTATKHGMLSYAGASNRFDDFSFTAAAAAAASFIYKRRGAALSAHMR